MFKLFGVFEFNLLFSFKTLYCALSKKDLGVGCDLISSVSIRKITNILQFSPTYHEKLERKHRFIS